MNMMYLAASVYMELRNPSYYEHDVFSSVSLYGIPYRYRLRLYQYIINTRVVALLKDFGC